MEKGKIIITDMTSQQNTADSLLLIDKVYDKRDRIGIVSGKNIITYDSNKKSDKFTIKDRDSDSKTESNRFIIHNCSNLPTRDILKVLKTALDTGKKPYYSVRQDGETYSIRYFRKDTADVYYIIGGQ